ncbi:MAG TPA: hypothetical protein VFE46_11870 [Pirellulales bacterium]|nr:hypothetical protein [Pirellulales bacterium]
MPGAQKLAWPPIRMLHWSLIEPLFGGTKTGSKDSSLLSTRGDCAMSTRDDVSYRRGVVSATLAAAVLFVAASRLAAVDLRNFNGDAKFILRGQETTGSVIYIDSSVVKVSYGKGSVPSEYKPGRDITEVRMNDDKLTFNRKTHLWDSAVEAQAKLNGRVRFLNNSKQPIKVWVTSYKNGIGEEAEIDQLRDPKANTWRVEVASGDSKYFSPGGQQLMTSMLKYDVETNDGKTHQLKERSPGLPPGGEFEVSVEDKDLHKPVLVQLVSFKFNQGDWSLERLEKKYNDNHDRKTESKSDSVNEHAQVGTGYGYGYGYAGAPYAPGYGNGYGAPGYAEHDKDTHHSERSSKEQVKADGKSESNKFNHTSSNAGQIIAVLNNPTDKKLAVTAKYTVRYIDRTNPEGKLANRSDSNTIIVTPNDKDRQWVIPIVGTDSTTEGTITEWDISTEPAPYEPNSSK